MRYVRSVALTLLFVTVLRANAVEDPQPFGPDFPQLDSWCVGEWWNWKPANPNAKSAQLPPFKLDVPRDEVVAFAVYTHDSGILKITAQLFPLKPDEPREVRLEIQRDGGWIEVARAPVLYPGWDAHFRVEKWYSSQNVPYRVLHGERARFEGVIRRDPINKETLVVASLSCNSSRTTGERKEIVANLLVHDPDLLFFAGDQTYRHTEHTYGWIEFGMQFRDVLRDRPTVTIPDDHDVGHGNLWGENGIKAKRQDGADGGYFYPPSYVNMVQRQQSWHLPDPVDPAPVEKGISVYFTRLRVGGVDFAILEDRKFKTGPFGEIPEMGPRPDHIKDPAYDRNAVNKPGLQLLGERQLRWLKNWTTDWRGAELKCVLSQTAFCGAVHMHGGVNSRLLADLDCNGWPQAGRDAALRVIRQAWAPHLCGDQHLGVVVKHGIETFGDGPYSFTNPAIINTIYGRWWHPLDEKPGTNPVPGSPLPWTGEYLDGLGNKISMLAYANPSDVKDEKQRGDGYGLVRFNKTDRTMVFECWPRFARVADGDKAQFPGWPLKFNYDDNDGRAVTGFLPELNIKGHANPVVQVIHEGTGEILYTVRAPAARYQPRVYGEGLYTIRVGRDTPEGFEVRGQKPAINKDSGSIEVPL